MKTINGKKQIRVLRVESSSTSSHGLGHRPADGPAFGGGPVDIDQLSDHKLERFKIRQ